MFPTHILWFYAVVDISKEDKFCRQPIPHLNYWCSFWATSFSNQQHSPSLNLQQGWRDAPTEAKSEITFFILICQVMAWLPHGFFQPCPAIAKILQKCRLWAGIRTTPTSPWSRRMAIIPVRGRLPTSNTRQLTSSLQIGSSQKSQRDWWNVQVTWAAAKQRVHVLPWRRANLVVVLEYPCWFTLKVAYRSSGPCLRESHNQDINFPIPLLMQNWTYRGSGFYMRRLCTNSKQIIL